MSLPNTASPLTTGPVRALSSENSTSLHILLADDDATMREYVKQVLGDHYAVEAVGDGLAALAATRERVPDLVLADILMPRMDGLELLRELRDAPRTRDVPVILISARAGDESKIESLNAGADDYLVKPFAAGELLARVDAHLGPPPTRQQAMRERARMEQALRESEERLRHTNDALAQRVAELEAANRKIHEARRASLNVLEDAIRSKEALREGEERLRLFVSASTDMVYRMNADWSVMYSLEGKNVIASTASASGTWLDSYIPADEQGRVRAAIEEAIRTKSVFELEHRCIGADGGVWVLSRAVPLLNPQGEIVEWFGAASDVTERRRAEEALRHSEELRRVALQGGRMGTWRWDFRRRLVWGDADFLALWGTSPGNGPYPVSVFTEWMSPEGRAALESVMARDTAPGEEFDGQLEIVGGPNAGHWVRWRGRAETETPWIANGVSFDVTEQTQAEQRLHQSEERFRQAAEASQLYAWEGNLRTRRARFSENAAAVLGFKELPAAWHDLDTVYETIHPDDRDALRSAVRASIAGKGDLCATYRGATVSGEYVWMEMRAKVVLDENGQPSRIHGVALNVDARRRIEEALRASEERFRAVANIVPDLLWSSEPDGSTTWYSDRWLQYTGLTLEQAAGSGWVQTIHPEDREDAEHSYRGAVQSGRCLEHEQRIRRADGEYRTFLVRAEPLRDEHGEVVRWFGSATDIDDLVRARAAVEAAGAAKDHFLAVLSHELRTPLMPITMALATLGRRQDLPEVVRKAHAMIKRNIDLESEFIDDLLDVTRIARGKMEVVRREMDLHEALERAVEVSSADIEAKSQRLSVSLEAHACHLQGDFARLQQVAWNLLKNASKFTPKTGEIHLRTHNAEPGRIVVEVIDTGIGMDAEALARVFQPFEQASTEITREYGGLGLGLAIAKGTVEAHGGELRVSSPGLGQGATFMVSLPLL